MHGTPHEQALLANRWLYKGQDRMWADFPRYWMTFNALYAAVREEGEPEHQAASTVVSVFFDTRDAEECLREIGQRIIGALVAVPPGDDRFDSRDPRYRRKGQELAESVKTDASVLARLVALMGIVYQVRCNLLHGSKDPEILRDQKLVSACTHVLRVVVPRLAKVMERHHHIPEKSGR